MTAAFALDDCSEYSDDSDDSDTGPTVKCELLPNPSPERKFLIYESCLYALLSICMLCSSTCSVTLSKIKGTWVELTQKCPKGHCKIWSSQPLHGTMPAGNLAVAAGIAFSGCAPTKALNFLQNTNIFSISMRTFNLMQRSYLVPAVTCVWERAQQKLLHTVRNTKTPVALGGDGRCDSPGHSAKYGTYTLMDLNSSKILELNLVQCNETTSSQAMELKGLQNALAKLDKEQIKIHSLTTDRHPSVKKYMRTKRPSIQHWFDVWHVAKGIYKKIVGLAKKAIYRSLQGWAQSVSNHIYWCAASSEGDGEAVEHKWISIVNHVADIHVDHPGEKFPKCLHAELTEDRAWLLKGSRVHKGLGAVVENKRLLADIPKLPPQHQTSSLEAFHKVICLFAPKSFHYFYNQMKMRCFIAVLHFNENSGRQQATTKTGEKQWRVSYPKYKKGQGVVKEVKTTCTYEYVRELQDEVVLLRRIYPSYKRAKVLVKEMSKDNPPTLSKTLENKKDKKTDVASHKTRFFKK